MPNQNNSDRQELEELLLQAAIAQPHTTAKAATTSIFPRCGFFIHLAFLFGSRIVSSDCIFELRI